MIIWIQLIRYEACFADSSLNLVFSMITKFIRILPIKRDIKENIIYKYCHHFSPF